MDLAVFKAKFDQYRKLIGPGAFPKTFKGIVHQIIAVSQDPHASAKDLAAIVSSDPAIAVKVLTVVNSPYYGLRNEVASLSQAIALLGFEETKKIALSVSVFEGFKRKDVIELLRIWKHSICVGVFSRIIAEHLRHWDTDAYTAGLLHDIGKILLYSVHPEAARMVQNNYLYERGKVSYIEIENRFLQIDHVWIGYCSACQWNLPISIREAILAHHNPALPLQPVSSALAHIVRIADLLAISLDFPSVLSAVEITPDVAVKRISEHYLDPLRIDQEAFKEILDKVATTGMAEAANLINVVQSSVSSRSAISVPV